MGTTGLVAFELICYPDWLCREKASKNKAQAVGSLCRKQKRAYCRLSDFNITILEILPNKEVQFEKNIERIRCDNGGEFVSNKMIDFYAREGIVLETSCPHTPQQNGVVERKHRHLLETARALKFEANLPTRFWGECVLTAAHVINRLPSERSKLLKKKVWTLENFKRKASDFDSKMGCLQNKYKPNGDVERYKARLVAKGCTQMEGVDFHETFAPVAKLVTVRTLLTVAVKRNWHIHQLDVNNAFLHGDLNEDVYMKLPEGFGIEVAKTKEGMVLSQRKYTLDILEDVGMTGSTRPDITYAVNILSQFVSDPRQPHMDAANRVLCYLKGTPGQGILIPRDGGTNLLAYCDSDWLGCPMTRRSEQLTTFYLGGLLVSGRPKKQSVVSKSSAEAEYRAMSNAVSEILWMRWLLGELDMAPLSDQLHYFVTIS
ncbi:integrase [Tanacetum coccineum]